MFIARGMHQTQQSPRGATGDSGTREVLFNARTQGNRERGTRRGWVPQPFGRGNLAPTIADISVTSDSILHLAPAGRYVYSTHGIHKYLKPQRGDM